MKNLALLLFLVVIPALGFSGFSSAQDAVWPEPIYYRTTQVGQHKIYYRESGSRKNPTILFLHGYPSSSHMYRHLIPLLSGSFHVVVPDNLGSGYSDKPILKNKPYTFDLLADVIGVPGVIASFFTVVEWPKSLVFGHPNHDNGDEHLTPIEFTLQATDYKSVMTFRKFTANNVWSPSLVLETAISVTHRSRT